MDLRGLIVKNEVGMFIVICMVLHVYLYEGLGPNVDYVWVSLGHDVYKLNILYIYNEFWKQNIASM